MRISSTFQHLLVYVKRVNSMSTKFLILFWKLNAAYEKREAANTNTSAAEQQILVGITFCNC